MKKVLIIGAGPAGLTAAYELLKSGGYDVTVLEESKDIGGIAKTVEADGNRMDLGGHRYFSRDNRVNEWWANIFPAQGKPSKDDAILGRDA
ncbi:MAG: FAD-dependent oxidoreductase, partial [Oscillospiraceae bacterium]|nr:FAD-dependent oxidoreductase [Oscillospiraceae bacterium]